MSMECSCVQQYSFKTKNRNKKTTANFPKYSFKKLSWNSKLQATTPLFCPQQTVSVRQMFYIQFMSNAAATVKNFWIPKKEGQRF